jgi:nucleotide-binding universal stress UspA family protein
MARPIHTIVCPVNLRHAAHETGAYDIALQQARVNAAFLHVVTVAPELERNLNIFDSKKYWSDKLKEFLAAFPPGDVACKTAVLIGSPHRQIVRYAEEVNADLIVMESSNPRVQDYLLGTTASHVVTHVKCSVFVVR